MKAIAYLETETVLVEDTAAKTSEATEQQNPPPPLDGETAAVAEENERMRAELAEE
jgi:hypothetical protein